MRRLPISAFLLLAMALPAVAMTIDPVIDEGRLLSPDAVHTLRSKLLDHNTEHDVMIVVMVRQDLQGEPIEEVSLNTARTLGIGKEQKNNGILLLLAPNDHKVRIEVGYGMEGEVTDADASNVILAMTPYFKKQEWSTGLSKGVDQLISLTSQHNVNASTKADDGLWQIGIGLVLLIFGITGFISIQDKREEKRFQEKMRALRTGRPLTYKEAILSARSSYKPSPEKKREISRRRDDSVAGAVAGAIIGSSISSSGSSSNGSDYSSGGFSSGGGDFGGGGASGDW